MADRPDVLLFVFDTLRPDYLSCYGEPSAVKTPNIDRVASEGTHFKQAFSAGPNTEISHGALFTGQYPSETGLVGGPHSVPEDIPTLASWFSEQGYATYGISGPSKIRSDLGFDRGFDTYVEPYYENLQPELSVDYFEQVARDALVRRDFFRTLSDGPDSLTSLKFDLLRERISGENRPFFGFVNFLTPHTPYNPPRPFKRELTPKLSRPQWFALEYALRLFGQDIETLDHDDVRDERVLRAAGGRGWQYHADSDWLTDAELDVLKAWYGACIRYLDAQFGLFRQWMDRVGRWEDTIVVLTADHGEQLGEHGLLYHGHFLYDETIHVPLMISGPGVESTVDDGLASLVDVFPTLCHLCGSTPPPNLSGCRILDTERQIVFAEYGTRDISQSNLNKYLQDDQRERYNLGMKCARTAENKFILCSNGETELYAPPDERQMRKEPKELVQAIHEILGEEFRPVGNNESINARTKANLRELGYIE